MTEACWNALVTMSSGALWVGAVVGFVVGVRAERTRAERKAR